MAIGRAIFGVAQAGCYPALNKVSKNWFAASGRTTAQGWIATFFGRMGGALSFIVFGSVMLGWLHLPWRWALGIFTLLGLVCGLLFLILFRNTPREHPWANAAESDLILAGDPAAATATHSRLDWARTLSYGSVWFLFVRAFASNVADVLYVYWIPMFLSDVKHLGHTNTGGLAALPLIGGALGGITSGWLQSALIRRTGRRRWARCGAGLLGKLIAARVMLLCLTVEDGVFIACLFLVVKFFSDWEQPAEWGTISDIAGPSAATLFATVNTIGAIGGFVAGPLTGLILQRFSRGEQVTAAGWNALFVCISLEYLLAASAWLFINADKPIDPCPGGLSR